MPTYDWTGTDIIPNGSGSAVRADVNDALLALFSQNSSAGASPPPETVAYMTWADTTAGVLKIRNSINSDWITLYQLDGEWTTLAIENGTAEAPSIYFKGSGTDTGFYSPGTDQVGVVTAGVERVEFGTTEVVFNDGGADVDFRVEGDTKPNLFKIDAGLDEVQVANLNGGPLAGFRNRIINGNFDFWQRGTSFTGNEYGADRWLYARIGTTHTVTRQAFTLGQTAVPNEPTYFCRTVVSSVAGAGNQSILAQRIEDVRTFAGQQVTISFWAKADATKNIAVELSQFFGTGGSPSANVTAIGTTKVSIGTTFQKVTVTATVPSISGKTLGTNNDHFLTAAIWFDAGSDFNARTDSLGQQSGTFEIAQVQVEPGSVATPFERRPIGTELALCQRYYEVLGPMTMMFPWGNATQIVRSHSSFAVTKRDAPTITMGSKIAGSGSAVASNTDTTGTTFAGIGSIQDVLIYTNNIASIEL